MSSFRARTVLRCNESVPLRACSYLPGSLWYLSCPASTSRVPPVSLVSRQYLLCPASTSRALVCTSSVPASNSLVKASTSSAPGSICSVPVGTFGVKGMTYRVPASTSLASSVPLLPPPVPLFFVPARISLVKNSTSRSPPVSLLLKTAHPVPRQYLSC